MPCNHCLGFTFSTFLSPSRLLWRAQPWVCAPISAVGCGVMSSAAFPRLQQGHGHDISCLQKARLGSLRISRAGWRPKPALNPVPAQFSHLRSPLHASALPASSLAMLHSTEVCPKPCLYQTTLPFLAASGYIIHKTIGVQVALDLRIAQAGVGGELTIVESGVPLTTTVRPSYRPMACMSLSFRLTMLAGRYAHCV